MSVVIKRAKKIEPFLSNHRKCNDGGDDEDLVVGELNSAKTREVVMTKFVIYDRLIFAKKNQENREN